MPPVLAQMQGDAVGAGLLREQCCIQRIGVAGAPRLAQRRHVIDIYAQSDAAMKLRMAHEPSSDFGSRRRNASMTSREFSGRPSRQASMAARNTRFASRNERAPPKLSICRSARD